jgi:hypothetical protein
MPLFLNLKTLVFKILKSYQCNSSFPNHMRHILEFDNV